jgi:hypothetical protein
MFWLAVAPARAEDLSWAFDVAHAHIAADYAWPESDYTLRISQQDPDRVVVYARHKEDDGMGRLNGQGFIRAGGGKSFEMHLSRKTHSVIREMYFQ